MNKKNIFLEYKKLIKFKPYKIIFTKVIIKYHLFLNLKKSPFNFKGGRKNQTLVHKYGMWRKNQLDFC